jgi:hypothetical protein
MTDGYGVTTGVTWQEAVARLARERTVAETCAALLKRQGDAAVITRGALAYGEAKAEYDGIIAGLIVALARKAEPASLTDLEARMRRGLAERQAFCRIVEPLGTTQNAGEKGWIEEAVKGAVEGVAGPLIDAIKSLWLRSRDDNALMRKTIETQLEAAVWRDFAAVAPSS